MKGWVLKGRLFAIPSLLAAGLVGACSSAEGGGTSESSVLDEISEIVSSITGDHQYTLALHRSHGSHGSHGSHRSHRSFHHSVPAVSKEAGSETAVLSDLAGTRNEMSTPRSSFLPKSYGVLKVVKVLPGNSEKFRDILIRVQVGLHVLGYEVGPVNGSMHAKTVAAIYEFQKDRGMVPSGKVTHQLVSANMPSRALSAFAPSASP